MAAPANNYRFLDFEVDLGSLELRRAGEPVALEPKVFAVLRYLIEHRERVVPKAELLAALWSAERVTEAVLPNNVAVLRRALGQRRGQRVPIETAHGRGYRFSAPVELGPAAVSSPARHAELGVDADPFVGREAVLQRLSQALDGVQAGCGQLWLVAGEPGSGKTRLLHQVRAIATARGVSATLTRCVRASGAGAAPALWPFTQLLRGPLPSAQVVQAHQAEHGELPAWAGEVLGALSPAVAPGPHAAAPTAAPFAQLDGLVRLVALLAARAGSAVWLIDDLHWADLPSLQALTLLAQDAADSPLLVVASVDEQRLPAADPRRQALVGLTRPRAVQHLPLGPLGQDALHRLAQAVLGDGLPAELLGALATLSQGNALLARDVLDGLLDATGQFDRAAYEARGAGLSPGAHAFIRARLAGLPPRVEAVLSAAAVVGEVFSVPLLQTLAACEHGALLDALDLAARRGIVAPVASNAARFRFAHASLCDALYAALPAAQRVRQHRRVADCLAAAEPSDLPALCEVARHYHRSLPGHDPRPAVDYARRAAEVAVREQRHALAAECYAQVLGALEALPGASALERAQARLAEARCLLEAGHVGQVAERCTRLLAMARRHALPEVFAQAVRLSGAEERFHYGRRAYPRVLLDEALATLAPDDRRLRPWLLVDRARCAGQTDAQRARWLAEAEALAGDVDAIALELASARLETLTDSVDAERLLRQSEEALARWFPPAPVSALVEGAARGAAVTAAAPEAAEAARGRRIAHYGLHRQRCVAWLTLGNLPAARRDNDACADIADAARWHLASCQCEMYRVGRTLAKGQAQQAWARADALVTQARPLGSVELLASSLALREAAARALGRPAALTEAAVAGFVRRLPASNAEVMLGAAWLMGDVHSGGFGARVLESVCRLGLAGMPGGGARLPALVQLASLAVALGAAAQAAWVLDALAPHAGRYVVARTGEHLGPAAHMVGMLHGLLGDDDACIDQLRRALTLADQMGVVVPALRLRIDLGAALARRAGQGDHASARACLATASSAASEHGLQGLSDLLLPLRRGLGNAEVAG